MLFKRVLPTFLLIQVLLILVASLAPVRAETFSQSDVKEASAVIKAYIEADKSKDFKTTLAMSDPAIMAAVRRMTGMSNSQIVAFADKTFRNATLRATPYFNQRVVARTRAGRTYVKVPVKAFSDARLAPFDGIATYIAYREGGKWYPLDLHHRSDLWLLFKVYPDFRGMKLFK
jgi:hypothetical protein